MRVASLILCAGFAGFVPLEAQSSATLAPTAAGGMKSLTPQSTARLPRVYAPTRSGMLGTSVYPWKLGIVSTVFWIGETATQNNPVPNDKSSWDVNWCANYGGYDDPDPSARTWDFRPKGFVPRQNPFYIALPYNDVLAGGATRRDAATLIPWFRKEFKAPGKTVIKGRWLAIRYGNKVCYAQWEDVGPFNIDDGAYVFGTQKQPRNFNNGGAGIDLSPAVRDFLGIRSGARVDWRFVETQEIPEGPWRKYGDNNPFSQSQVTAKMREEFEQLREARDRWYQEHGDSLRNQ